MWHLGMWLSVGFGSVGLMARINDLRGFFYNLYDMALPSLADLIPHHLAKINNNNFLMRPERPHEVHIAYHIL